jgi:exopolysaccharide biosynthesis polyprenyl glycosylphosphotransferase
MHSEWAPTPPVASERRDASQRQVDTPAGAARADADARRLDAIRVVPAPEPVGEHSAERRHFGTQLKVALVASDVVATAAGMVLATLAYRSIESQAVAPVLPTALLSLPLWPVLYAQQGLYQARRLGRRLEELRRIVNAVLAGLLVLAGISVLLQDNLSRGWLALVVVGVISTMTLEREVARRVIGEFRARGVMTRRVVIVGRNGEAREIASMLSAYPELGYEVVGFAADPSDQTVIDLRPGRELGPYLGRPREVLELVRATSATGVLVATTGVDQDAANQLIRDLTREGLYVELTSAMRDISSSRISVRPLGRYPIVCVEPVAAVSWRRIPKRIFDLVCASLLLVLATPLLIVAALLIRLTSGPGVLFRQQRVGRDGVPFTVYKLRTMVRDAEAQLAELQAHNEAAGPMFKMSEDPRVTGVGRVLRAFSIDELPQLWNVLVGDMSLVGPRPALPDEAAQWDAALRERLRVQPGITGMWQVSGRYTASLETYARLDLYYVDNWSLVTDVAILFKTVGVVLRREGGA